MSGSEEHGASVDSAPADAGQDRWFVATSASDDRVVDALSTHAKRGKLPGFSRGGGAKEGVLFSVTDFGAPFESRIDAKRASGGEGGRTGLDLTLHLKPTVPIIAAVVMVLTVYPGVYLTDMFMREFFANTLAAKWVWWWHIGLSAPFLPLAMLSAVRKSRESGRTDGAERVRTIREVVSGLDDGAAVDAG